ncbi:MAG: hypothetical protein LLG04_06175 [Parachlamydia sp.]|nr:hypothetical protein [Parachlamydia sp.]
MKFFFGIFCLLFGMAFASEQMVFVTVADAERYAMLGKCLDSIVETNRENLQQIAVFDLGFSESQRKALAQREFVHVYDIERVNPDMMTLFVVRSNGRMARGWYSWKHVVLKQALDMFPEILYMDASTIVKKPLDLFFGHIRENGYLLINCWHDGSLMTTQTIIKKFQLDSPERAWVLKERGVDAGFQGLSRAVYADYVLPVYDLAKDIRNFEDDGTAPLGFGYSRHDQTLFNIMAQLLKFDITQRDKFALNISGQPLPLPFEEYVDLKGLKRKPKQ